MRVAIVAGRDPSISTDTDGGSVFLEHLMQQFDRRGSQVDVFIPSGVAGGLYSENRKKVQGAGGSYGNTVTITYFDVARNAGHIENDIDYFLERSKRSMEFVDFFKDKKLFTYDLVFILHVSNAFGIVLNKLTPIEKTVLFPMMTSENYRLFTHVPEAYVWLEKAVFRSLHHICSPSDDEIDKIIRAFGVSQDTLFKVHRGFDPDQFQPVERRGDDIHSPLTLLCANGIRPQKDHLFLIDVARELNALHIPHTWILTGNDGKSHNPVYNAYTRAFWERVAQTGLSSLFISHDVVSRHELIAYMKRSHVAVYTSISETFGKSALESVVSGLPTVVCSDVPAYEEFISHDVTGIRAEREAHTFANEIARLSTDPDLYERISINGISLRPQFTWEHVMDDLFSALRVRKVSNDIVP